MSEIPLWPSQPPGGAHLAGPKVAERAQTGSPVWTSSIHFCTTCASHIHNQHHRSFNLDLVWSVSCVVCRV